MNILIFNWQCIKNPFGGGAEVHLHEIFKRIVRMGHNVTLCCCEIDGEPLEEIIDGIQIQRFGKRNTFNFIVPKIYKHKYQKEKYDIVIDDINKIPFYLPMFVGTPLLAISHHFFGSSIFKEAGLIAGTYVYLSEKIVNLIYKHTEFAVVSQSTLNEFLERGFNPNRFSIIQNAIEQNEFPMRVMTKAEFPTITYFGRMKKYKSVDNLLEAFAIVKEKIPNAKLNLLGRGDYQIHLEKLAVKLGINEATTFFGFVSEEEKKKQLSLSHIVVNTSMKEGWGITNIEANACGTPIISANSPGLRDSVKEGSSGLLYEYGNVKELASKIIDVLENKQKLEHLSNGAVEWAKTFSWDKSAEKMLILIQEVIAKHHKRIKEENFKM